MANNDTLNILYKIRKEISKSNNKQLMSEIDYTIKKVYDDLFVISFIGHFSAGKSSLINYLLEENVLPSSPIPTTSKTVQIEVNDETLARVYIDKNHFVKLNDLSEVKEINKKDVAIEYVKIMHESKKYNNTFVFQDTPGVDSKTSAHEESTDKFLLNSDYVFFTVEYNHVESESNLSFLSEIASYNIPFSLIINQIDKHDDSELSYDTFIRRLNKTLENHGITPEHIFTTSIYDTQYRQNSELETFLKKLDHSREEFKTRYHDRITKNIESKHVDYLNDMLNNLQVDEKTISDLKTHISYLEEEKDTQEASEIKQDKSKLKRYVDKSTKSIVDNSYLFPHDVKDSIREYFKISTGEVTVKGLFGKKKKLDSMKKEQLSNVRKLMQDIIDRQINTQVNDLFFDLKISTSDYFKYEYHDSLLIGYDITESNEKFLHVYLDQLKQMISREVREQVNTYIDSLNVSYQNVETEINVKEELARYKKALDIKELKEVFLSGSYKNLYTHVDEDLKALNKNFEVSLDQIEDLTEEKVEIASYDFKSEALNTDFYKKITDLVSTSESYKDIYKLLQSKLSRLDNDEANISVFGGFSAGKSTFINALLKEKLLTTSPNPTTASITEISNNEKSYIEYKSEDSLIKMLKTITGKSGISLDKLVSELNKKEVSKLYIPLKNGLNENLKMYRPLFGQTVESTKKDIDFKTSEDSHAIFIEKAYIGDDAPLLENFTIVDSPGINSINDRHTQETYHIIANSDLIMYVSYFNHVFTESDAQFLKYIQSIKGKEFPLTIIINAVDLAKDTTEIEDVKEYMHQSLNQLKIQHDIYCVSSKYALNHNDASFESLKAQIFKNAESTSRALLAKSIDENIKQFIELLKSNIKQFNDGENYIQTLIKNRKDTYNLINTFSASDITNEATKEMENLFTFMPKQLELKLYDYLSSKISINDTSKKALNARFEELSNDISQYLTIEINTILNNIFRFIDQLLIQQLNDFNVKLRESSVVDTITYRKTNHSQITISTDKLFIKENLKQLEKKTKTHKQLRDNILILSKKIIESLELDDLKRHVNENINVYFDSVDYSLKEDKNRVLKLLNKEVETPSEEKYHESVKLLNKIKQSVGEYNVNY